MERDNVLINVTILLAIRVYFYSLRKMGSAYASACGATLQLTVRTWVRPRGCTFARLSGTR